MTESETEMISRRSAFSILGLATLGLAVPAAVLTVSDAQAQSSTAAPPAPETGTERRQQRRTDRQQGRQERRTERQENRQERRTQRTEGRAERSGTAPTNPANPK